MTDKQPVKRAQFYGGGKAYEHGTCNGEQYVRDDEGVWRYPQTLIPVPGARDMTLTERFKPKPILDEQGKVERVVVSGKSISEAPNLLSWCLTAGRSVEDEKEVVIEVLVPYEIWKEHDRIPNAVIAPEHSDDPAERELALAERNYREADKTLEAAADKRAEVLQRYADVMTRQQARAITGLSIGRIQQLSKPDRPSAAADTILQILVAGTPMTLAAVNKHLLQAGLDLDEESTRRRLRELQLSGLVERRGAHFGATPSGEAELIDRGSRAGSRPR
jgi:hypothetical protein